ncbi:hypothetical protein CRE_30097 [Caenorhabditis remanei]|uniref:T20D4.11-like domain-containing protein n=1 Tax=Caenorhabditis remanei TaxID=31234 RepID=E3MYG3_CAERE|nr:hypothetical protein CRE_30097 [Caenorhabditis remanei]
MFHVLLFSVLFVFPIPSTSEHCDQSILLSLFKCSDIASNLTIQLQKLKDMPPASQMGTYLDLCESYLFCLEKIECPDAQKHLQPREKAVTSMCNGMKFMAGPFGKCVEKLRSNSPSLKKYPCARHFVNQVGRPGNCEMYQTEYECTQSLVKDQCGIEALDELETHKSYILSQMHCK